MSYELLKPYTKEEKFDFIVKYNHNQGLTIKETEKALVAIEKNEYIENDEILINPNYEEKTNKEFEKQKILKNLNDLDMKRIRAICENEVKDKTTGQTWLDYYNNQVINLRKKLQNL